MSSDRDTAKRVYTISIASRNLRPIFNRVYHYGERIVITRHRHEKVAMVPMRDYKRLIRLDTKKKLLQGVDKSQAEKGTIRRAEGPPIGTFSKKKKIKKQPGKKKTERPLLRFEARGRVPGRRK